IPAARGYPRPDAQLGIRRQRCRDTTAAAPLAAGQPSALAVAIHALGTRPGATTRSAYLIAGFLRQKPSNRLKSGVIPSASTLSGLNRMKTAQELRVGN